MQALNYINAYDLDYNEWVQVGMALKHEGYAASDWDRWSQNDKRYKQGECERKWNSFNEASGTIVTGGTIVDLAKKHGFTIGGEIKVFDWDDEIQYDGEDPEMVIKDPGWIEAKDIQEPTDFDPTDQLRQYLQTLFREDDIIGFCIDAEKDEDGKWKPSTRGSFGFTQKQLLDDIKKHPDNIKDVIGDYNEEAGAWIRFNPLDGQGVGNVNVTDLRYALVESDNLEIERQKILMEELQLPIAVMVHSGGKSIHAIVKINAVNTKDYREKVDYLYRICEKNGLSIDTKNKNPSRMSRMPGVYRGEKKQYILARDIGKKDFEEWKEYIEESADTLPEIVDFMCLDELPEMSPELVKGILRKGHKMLISSQSKAGKSFLAIELGLCMAYGKEWLSFPCEKGNILYLNMEVDGASFYHRIEDVRLAMGLTKDKGCSFDVWNLRGENTSIEKLAPILIRRAKRKKYDAIIFDPLYKINQGDENNASEMSRFFNQLDTICKELNTAVISIHHHSKGSQGGKFSIDRASGSGVFARDPDALIDLIRLNPSDAGVSLANGETAWRVSFTLREFSSPDDIDVIFKHPIHVITKDLKEAQPMSGAGQDVNSQRGNREKKKNIEKKYDKLVEFVMNWESYRPNGNENKSPTLLDASEHFKGMNGFSVASMRRWIEQFDNLDLQNGVISLK